MLWRLILYFDFKVKTFHTNDNKSYSNELYNLEYFISLLLYDFRGLTFLTALKWHFIAPKILTNFFNVFKTLRKF